MTANHEIARICVVVISYNQENLISRALDSVLQQKEYGLHKIIVCDDCSQDNTWKVLEEYHKKYDKFLEIHRNDKNLGIYQNLAKAYSMIPNTDIILNLSGDDIFFPSFFSDIQSWIKRENIDPQEDKFVLYGDIKVIYPNGKERILRNNALIRYKKSDAFSLKIKHLLFSRSTATTYACFKSFDRIPVEMGLCIAEEICDLQQSIHSKRNYYEPKVWSGYYSGVGISTKMNGKYYREERVKALKYIIDNYALKEDDLYSLYHDINLYNFFDNASLKLFFSTWKWYFKAFKSISMIYIVKTMLKMITYRSKVEKSNKKNGRS